MPGSDVRDIEALEAFRIGLLKFADDGEQVLQQYRTAIGRAASYFADERPAYWRHQIRRAERDLNEAKEELSRKLSTARSEDRPAATEATVRVSRAERRLQYCFKQDRLAAAIAREISQQCDAVLGPVADATEQCTAIMPTAAGELAQLIEQLRRYAEQAPPESN